MKKIRKYRGGLSFLSTLLLLFSVLAPISFAEGYTMKVWNTMVGVPADKVFRIKFNDVPDVNHILQAKGIRIVDLQDVPQDITLSLDPSDSEVLWIKPPRAGYTPGKEYLLYIHNNWMSKSGRKLRQGIQMAFRISETPMPSPSPIPSPSPAPAPNPSPNPIEDFIFDKTTGTITGYRGTADHVVIPEQIDGVPVRYIGEGAFFYNDNLTAVTIPDSVTSIHDSAFFYCKNLRSLTLGNGLKSIGIDAFFHCSKLAELTIPDSVTIIHREAFDHCGLRSLTLGNGLKSIGIAAFSYCSIDNLTLPASLHDIGDFAFYYNNIDTLHFAPHGTLETIGSNVFAYNQLTSLTIPGYVRTIGDSAFWRNSISALAFENGVQIIGKYAFNENQITSLVIPNSVQTIEDATFLNNPLVTVELPAHTSIIEKSLYGNDDSFPDSTRVIRRP